MLIFLYFVTSNFSDGPNWLFSCLPEGIKPLGENLIFPRLRPYIVINFKMGSFKLLLIKAYWWNSKLENQQAKKNLWVIEWGIIPSILRYFPLWKRKFPRSIIPRRCPRMVHHMQLEDKHWALIPQERGTQAGAGRCRAVLAAKAPVELSWAEPGQAGAPKPKQSMRYGQSSHMDPLPFQPGRNSGHWWLQCLLSSLLFHTWSTGFPGSKGSVPDPVL